MVVSYLGRLRRVFVGAFVCQAASYALTKRQGDGGANETPCGSCATRRGRCGAGVQPWSNDQNAGHVLYHGER